MFSFFPMGMSPLYLVVLAIQIYFAVHAVRSGRFGWLFIILFFPALGAIIYFIAEYLPELKQSGRTKRIAGNVAGSVANVIDPGRKVRELEAKLKLTPSFANRQALADAYLEADRIDEAIALYEQNTTGIHAEDPGTLSGLALAWARKGDVAKALGYAERYRKKKETSLAGEMDLLYAALLEKSGDVEGAIREYRILARKNIGEEARYRAGLLLRLQGREEEALAEFEEVVRGAEVLPAHYKKANKQWIELAKKELGSRS